MEDSNMVIRVNLKCISVAGGVVNVMPLMYSKISPIKEQVNDSI